MATARTTKTAYKCPQCGQALMQSKDKLVCINDGWSSTVAQFIPVGPPPDPEPTKKAEAAAQAKPFVPIPLPKPAATSTKLSTSKEVPPMVEPKVDQKLVTKRKLEKVVGDKKVAQAQAKIDNAKQVSQTLVNTYKDDLKELLPGETGKYLKNIGIALFVVFIIVMIFTLHLIPGL